MPLKDQIKKDLTQYSTSAETEKYVISEESIRLMMHVFNTQGRLVQPTLLKSSQVAEFLMRPDLPKTHCQLLIESGTRHPIMQGIADSVHYFAIDVFPSKDNIILFLADHYFGHNYSGNILESEKLDDRFKLIYAGGTHYQMDAHHCPIFALQHLLLTAHDSSLKDQLQTIATTMSGKREYLPWFNLAPKYNVATQSMTTLCTYAAQVHSVSGVAATEDAPSLKEAKFDEMIAMNLEDVRLSSGELKVQNRCIDHLTRQYASELIRALSDTSEDKLIDICYVDPNIRTILHNAVAINPHHQHLFELFFLHYPLLKAMDSQTKSSQLLTNIFMHRSIVSLMDLELLQATDLFKMVTDTSSSKDTLFKSALLTLICKNLPVMDALLATHQRSDVASQLTREKVLYFLTAKNTKLFFEDQPTLETYVTGLLEHTSIDKIRADQFKQMIHERMLHTDISLPEHAISLRAISPVSVTQTAAVAMRPCFFLPLTKSDQGKDALADHSDKPTVP